jgi:hypothetical protein
MSEIKYQSLLRGRPSLPSHPFHWAFKRSSNIRLQPEIRWRRLPSGLAARSRPSSGRTAWRAPTRSGKGQTLRIPVDADVSPAATPGQPSSTPRGSRSRRQKCSIVKDEQHLVRASVIKCHTHLRFGPIPSAVGLLHELAIVRTAQFPGLDRLVRFTTDHGHSRLGGFSGIPSRCLCWNHHLLPYFCANTGGFNLITQTETSLTRKKPLH